MGFQVITLTDAAENRVREIVSGSDGAAGIRIGIKKGGCAGMEYTIDLVQEPESKDDKVEFDGGAVFVDPSAVLFLLGTEMDFEVTKLRTGFVFNNPNQTSACGCGESVELVPAAARYAAAPPKPTQKSLRRALGHEEHDFWNLVNEDERAGESFGAYARALAARGGRQDARTCVYVVAVDGDSSVDASVIQGVSGFLSACLGLRVQELPRFPGGDGSAA